jgi:hypothetical protein
MEEEKDYHTRRILEIKQRIDVLNNYIKTKLDLKNTEIGVGGSYKKRRNSRNFANKSYRLSEFTSEIESLESLLKIHTDLVMK